MSASPTSARRRRCVATVAVLAALGGAFGCRSNSGPNVVIITLDTTRADRLGAMGHAGAKTPVLDALAAQGVVFERAYASSPVTLPSHSTLLTGLEPPRHGVHDNGVFVLPQNVETVAEIFGKRGYSTAAFVSAFVLDASFGLDQGFDEYDAETPLERSPLVSAVPRRNGDRTTDAALAWLAKRAGRPFFLWTHYYDVHLPRVPPAPFDEMKDRYDGALAFTDAQVGRLLEGVRAAAGGRETVIVVTADHGEGLGEHDERTHGAVVYDSTLHVPLIVSGPGFPAGTRSQRFVRAVDVAETLLVAADIRREAPGEGIALQGRAAETTTDRIGYFETYLPTYTWGWAALGGVRTERWKLTAEPAPIELYDVVADPKETKNLADAEPDVVARLKDAYSLLGVDRQALASPPETADSEVAERLAALGYVSVPQQFGEDQQPDPRKHVAALSRIEDARSLALMGYVAPAVEHLERLAADRLVRPLALRALGPLYASVGRPQDAVDAIRALSEILGTAESRIDLATALIATGTPEQALAELDAVGERGAAQRLRLRLVRAVALLATGRAAEAEQEAESVLAEDPANDRAMVIAMQARIHSGGVGVIVREIDRLRQRVEASPRPERLPQARLVLASFLHRKGQDKEATKLLEVEGEPPLEHLVLLARIARQKGNLPRAEALLAEVVRRQPSSQETLLELADVYDAQKRPDRAEKLYELMLVVNAKDATLWLDRGSFRARRGDVAGAESDYRKALEIDAKLPEANLNLALVLAAKGNDEEAEKLLLAAIDDRPDYAKAHFHLARIYRARNDPRAAQHAELAASGDGAAPAPASATGSP